MYTYHNTFHNTTYNSRKSPQEIDAIRWRLAFGCATKADHALRRKMHKALCGATDCICGDAFGRRE